VPAMHCSPAPMTGSVLQRFMLSLRLGVVREERRANRRISVKGATPKPTEFVHCADRLPTRKHLHPFE
jgi:hypothetical protein